MAAIATIESARIFAQHRDEVYRWAYRLLGRHHDALDVAQDVFVKWAEAAREKPPIDNPRAWLRRVTINRAIDAVRARTTAMAVAIDVAAPCTASAGVDALEREELRREIALALEPLTDMQRSVLIARTFEELTFADIAVELGVAVPTVKTHYLRAVSAVRDRLARSQDQERV
jgi:RNA polymerase sigma-70 factor (ECF subfamily)